MGSFSHTSRAGFFLCGDFLLHIPCWLLFMWGILLQIPCWLLCVGSFSDTSCAGFFMLGVSLTCTVLASSCGVSLTYPMLASLRGEFLLHTPCWLLDVCLTRPLVAASCWDFLLHISWTQTAYQKQNKTKQIK